MKKFTTVILSLSATSLFAGTSIMPPIPPSFPTGDEVRGTPKSCKSIPMMLVHLPPPMQVEFDKCKNDMYMPFHSKTAQTLIKKFGKDAKLETLSVADGFHRLYKVVFSIDNNQKTIYTNESLTLFLDSEVLEFKEKTEEVKIKEPVKEVEEVKVVEKLETKAVKTVKEEAK